MARALALILCAVVASAAALSNHGAAQVDELSVSHSHVVAAVEQVAQELETELVALIAEAERHHSRLTAVKGIDYGQCIETSFNDAVIVASRILDLIDSVNQIANALLSELGKCKGNVITSLPCRLKVLSGALKKVRELNGKGKELLLELKRIVRDFKKNCIPSKPTQAPTEGPTEGPTAGPTEGPTAGPTEGPTAGPTDGPTEGPTAGPTEGPTDGPTDGPTAGPTEGPTGGPTEGPTAGPSEAPARLY